LSASRTDSSCGELDVKKYCAFGAKITSPAERPDPPPGTFADLRGMLD